MCGKIAGRMLYSNNTPLTPSSDSRENTFNESEIAGSSSNSDNLKSILLIAVILYSPAGLLKVGKVDSGSTAPKETKVYTGDQMIGISIIHKSCLQPVFSQQAAQDAANMRR